MILMRFMLTTLLLILLSACASNAPAPAVSDDGLELVQREGIETLYVREGVDLGKYSRVLIKPPTVKFRKYWLRDANTGQKTLQTQVRPEDMEKASAELSALFVERFTKTLDLAGYPVTDTPGEDVLELVPAIVELDLFSINLSYRQTNFIQTYNGMYTSQMTLVMELADAATGTTLARASDTQQARRIAPKSLGNEVLDIPSTTVTLDRWAKKLVDALNESRA